MALKGIKDFHVRLKAHKLEVLLNKLKVGNQEQAIKLHLAGLRGDNNKITYLLTLLGDEQYAREWRLNLYYFLIECRVPAGTLLPATSKDAKGSEDGDILTALDLHYSYVQGDGFQGDDRAFSYLETMFRARELPQALMQEAIFPAAIIAASTLTPDGSHKQQTRLRAHNFIHDIFSSSYLNSSPRLLECRKKLARNIIKDPELRSKLEDSHFKRLFQAVPKLSHEILHHRTTNKRSKLDIDTALRMACAQGKKELQRIFKKKSNPLARNFRYDLKAGHLTQLLTLKDKDSQEFVRTEVGKSHRLGFELLQAGEQVAKSIDVGVLKEVCDNVLNKKWYQVFKPNYLKKLTADQLADLALLGNDAGGDTVREKILASAEISFKMLSGANQGKLAALYTNQREFFKEAWGRLSKRQQDKLLSKPIFGKIKVLVQLDDKNPKTVAKVFAELAVTPNGLMLLGQIFKDNPEFHAPVYRRHGDTKEQRGELRPAKLTESSEIAAVVSETVRSLSKEFFVEGGKDNGNELRTKERTVWDALEKLLRLGSWSTQRATYLELEEKLDEQLVSISKEITEKEARVNSLQYYADELIAKLQRMGEEVAGLGTRISSFNEAEQKRFDGLPKLIKEQQAKIDTNGRQIEKLNNEINNLNAQSISLRQEFERTVGKDCLIYLTYKQAQRSLLEVQTKLRKKDQAVIEDMKSIDEIEDEKIEPKVFQKVLQMANHRYYSDTRSDIKVEDEGWVADARAAVSLSDKGHLNRQFRMGLAIGIARREIEVKESGEVVVLEKARISSDSKFVGKRLNNLKDFVQVFQVFLDRPAFRGEQISSAEIEREWAEICEMVNNSNDEGFIVSDKKHQQLQGLIDGNKRLLKGLFRIETLVDQGACVYIDKKVFSQKVREFEDDKNKNNRYLARFNTPNVPDDNDDSMEVDEARNGAHQDAQKQVRFVV